MNDQLHRLFLGAVAFAFVVTWVTLGFLDAFLATGACLLVVNAKALARVRPARKPKPKPVRRHAVAHELVPDEPSLVL
jgi:hypothetical protein